MIGLAGVALVFLLGLAGPGGEARKVAPLIEDEWARRPHRAAECTFGKQIRELGSTWYADLGPPFGVMYCIKCECIPIQKKRRIIARVQCRNIKNECPKPMCDEPVLLPGRCCKSCPGDYSAEIVHDLPIQQTLEEEERSLKHFATLISSRTSRHLHDEASETNPSIASYVAAGRFTFHRKNLYYSFTLGASTPRPRSLQFIDDEGSILEEQIIDPIGGAYQNATGKLCGVWRRVPRDYRKILREEQLFVSLIWETTTTTMMTTTVTSTMSTSSLTGQLARYKALSTEQFSSLLEPTMGVDRTMMTGSSATAIISVSSTSAPSIHVSLAFNGVFFPEDIVDVPLIVIIEHVEKDYVLLTEEITIKKPSNDINFGEVRSALSGADLRLLSRGKLYITIASRKDSQALRLAGPIGPRTSCDVFQALLAPESGTEGSGLAWAFLDRFGALRYGMKLAGIDDKNPMVTLVDDGVKRKTELEDLTASLIAGTNGNGTLERPGPRLLEPLFKGELGVVVNSPLGSTLRGRLMQRPVAEAKDTSTPFLLRPAGSNGNVGLIWLAIDADCVLHYELEVGGLPEEVNDDDDDDEEEASLRLYLETMPLLAQGAPVSRRLLEEFNGNVLEGSVTGLSPIELYRIDSGIGFLEVMAVNKNVSTKMLKGQFKTRAPLSCLPHYADNDVASVMVYSLHPSSAEIETASCFHETRFYEEGIQWTAKSDPCLMCHCHRGVAKCDTVPCPPINCPAYRRARAPPGHCCSVCLGLPPDNFTTENPPRTTPGSKTTEDTNSVGAFKGCTLAGQFHVAGASWHPYLPPAGFDTCAICTCDPVSLEVRCPRVQCPTLDCDEKIAVRPDKKACCRQCPLVSVIPIGGTNPPATNPGGDGCLPKDQADSLHMYAAKRTPEEILADGGCKYPMGGPYENGKEWHPKIHSHGEIKCVKCRCKNGEVRCDRKRCPRSLCNSIANQLKRGERIPDADDCCTTQCRRARRHHRNHRNNHHHHQQTRHHASSKNPKHSVTPRDLS
ncbi:dorsal-ventral patterning protein Sog [Fopius arisanus]|uniref:Dorsal-ventral patterning protein Sog n=1 Tax=Fopius arisanus TaxID=64838 RepID=A0A9R1TDX1_9HYME|nr:PREDICTED: dorsal-ventral patterning protein Sog [Fopius arisanus]